MKATPMHDFGDMMTIEEFVKTVLSGGFIDWDGSGYYSDGKVFYHEKPAWPSEIMAGKIDRSFTHVAWFNK